MERPEFPKDFMLQHCPKVLQEREYRKRYTGERDDEEDLLYAECAFNSAGFGLTCESCHLHVSPCRVNGGVMYSQDEHFADIKRFYRNLEIYEKQENSVDCNLGEGI